MNFLLTITKALGLSLKKNGAASFACTLQGNQTATLTAARTMDLPNQDASSTLVSIDSTDTLTNKSVSGSSNTITNVSLTAGVTGVLPRANGGTNSSTVLSNNRFMVSSGGKIDEAAAVTASRAVVSDANGLPTASTVTSTTLAFMDATSSVQTQLNAKLCSTSVAAISSNVTLTNGAVHLVDTSLSRSLTLPSPVATAYITIKDKIGSCATNNITILRAASEKIETVAASYVLDTDLGAWTFVSDGTDWFII